MCVIFKRYYQIIIVVLAIAVCYASADQFPNNEDDAQLTAQRYGGYESGRPNPERAHRYPSGGNQHWNDRRHENQQHHDKRRYQEHRREFLQPNPYNHRRS